jgi:hypothetical protein
LLPQALQRMDGDHLLGVGCVVAGLLPATLTSWLGARAAARARVGPDSRPPSRLPDPPAVRRGAQATSQVAARRRAQLGLVLVVLVFALPQWQLFAWLIDGQGPVRAAWVEHRGRSLPLASPADASHVEDVVRDLAGAAHAGQRLFIGPSDLSRTWYSDLHIHHLFPDLPPASYYLEMNPGSADRPGSRLAADLASADWLLLSRRWDLLDGVGASRWQGSAEPQRVVAELFALRSERGPYRLFERRREPARTP